MRIGTRLYVGMLLPVAALAVLGGILAASMQHLNRALAARGELDRAHELTFEMELRMQEYIATGLPRARVQWLACCDALLGTIRGLAAEHTPEPETRNAVLARVESLRGMFEEFDAVRAGLGGTNGAAARERLKHLTAEMQVTIAGVVADAARLKKISRRRSMDIMEWLRIGAVAGLAGLTAGMLVIAWAMGRGIVRPILRLREGTAIIGAGNLDHRVGMLAEDEIGQLSRSFDEMVANLRNVTASRDELDREVVRRKQAEDELQKALGELKRSNADLELFAYSASHDLQEPLRKVSAFGALLQKEYSERIAGEGSEYLAIMLSATQRMQRLIEGLLAYARVSTRGKAPEPVDMTRAVSEAVSDLEPRIRETGGCVSVGTLPVVNGDAVQMRQLMQNLIANALKFHKPGVAPRVDVYCEVERAGGGEETTESPMDGHCRIVVRDNGIGFEEKHRDRIFGMFQRLHTRAEYEGSGIGLAVCRRIVERHNGTIAAESKPGEGAKFTVVLPLAGESGSEGGSS